MSTKALCSVYASLYQKCLDGNKPVSYTHLTLPTTLQV